MAGRFLLDTNIVIALLAEEPAVRSAISDADEVFLSSLVLGGLYFGAQKSQRAAQNLARIERLAGEVSVLVYAIQTLRGFTVKSEICCD
jgi:tRNA(fMet)-specific endonuclease VapC